MNCYEKNGVEIIKDALIGAQKKANKSVLAFLYMGGGKYKMTIEAENYKNAEQTIEEVTEFVTTTVIAHNGNAEFVREGQ